MKLNSDTPRAARLRAALADMMADEGDTTTLNGVKKYLDNSPLKADWVEKPAGHAELQLENEWYTWPVYEVFFPGRGVLDPPFSIARGSVARWETMGWDGIVQQVYPDSSSDIVIGVLCLVSILIWNHTCSLYSTSRVTNTDGIGTPGPEQITKVASGVPCHFMQTANLDDPSGIGRIKRPTIYTTDILYLSTEQEIEDGWWVRNTTLKPDGSEAATFGDVYKITGAPQIILSSGKQSVQIMQEEDPPEGIP